MKSTTCASLVVLSVLLIACCLVGSLGAVLLLNEIGLPESDHTAALWPTEEINISRPQATTRTPQADAQPTRSIGSSGASSAYKTPSPVLVKNLNYDIRVPTPNAPTIVYSIAYESNLKVVTYPVQGTTFKTISASLDASSLPDPHEANSRFYARTLWHLGGNWNWKRTSRGCELDRGNVTMQITVTLPIMQDPAALPNDVNSRWSRFVENTITHEVGHVNRALQGSREFQRDLGNMPPQSDCNRVASKAKDMFEQAFASIDRANVDYDQETRHGISQGAVFP